MQILSGAGPLAAAACAFAFVAGPRAVLRPALRLARFFVFFFVSATAVPALTCKVLF